ncbi:MAG: substrate-binding domain-containing protein [Litorivicinaceae bacterium]
MAAQSVIHAFREGLDLDALFVANDHMAIAVMDALRLTLGLEIPKDISVVGFDDAPPASWGSYQLTTYTQPLEPMVIRAVEILIQMIQEPGIDYEHVLISGTLKIRNTVR